jgi:hypothetical protein
VPPDAFAAQFLYTDTVDDGTGNQVPNPETKQQFTQRMIRDYVKTVVASHEGRVASDTAAAAARAAIG